MTSLIYNNKNMKITKEKKYAITLYHVAHVKQTIYVDAETEEEAENKVFEGEMWDDGNWQYVGVDMDSYPEVLRIESLEEK
jgi:hypothetical protein